MPILQIGFLIALIAGLEGVNALSGGDMYLASLRLLTEDTSGTQMSAPPPPPPQEAPPPPPPPQEAPPPPPPQEAPPPPPPSSESTAPTSAPVPPPMPATSEGHEPPMMPPPSHEPPMMPPMMPYEGGRQMMPATSEGHEPPMMPPPPGGRPGMRPGEMRGEMHFGPNENRGRMMPPMPYENNQMRGGMPGKRMPQQMPSMNNPFRQFERSGEDGAHNEFREEGGDENEGGNLDPRMVSQTLSEIKRMLGDIKRLKSQVKKAGLNSSLAGELEEIGTDLNRFSGILTGGADDDAKRETIDEFRDGEYHERLNSLRAKIEVPQEIKKLSQAIKRLEKILGTKAIKALGLDLGKVASDIAEMKSHLAAAQESLNGGDYDEARAQLGEFHEGGVSPSTIESALLAIRDAKKSVKKIRDESLRQKIEQALTEAINAFNNGEYDEVREAFRGIR